MHSFIASDILSLRFSIFSSSYTRSFFPLVRLFCCFCYFSLCISFVSFGFTVTFHHFFAGDFCLSLTFLQFKLGGFIFSASPCLSPCSILHLLAVQRFWASPPLFLVPAVVGGPFSFTWWSLFFTFFGCVNDVQGLGLLGSWFHTLSLVAGPPCSPLHPDFFAITPFRFYYFPFAHFLLN